MVDSYKKVLALHVGGAVLSKLINTDRPTFLKKRSDGTEEEVTTVPLPEEGELPVLTGGCGFSVTLDFMVRLSNKRDMILDELLAVMPTMVALSEFMERQTLFKVSEEDFKFLVKLGHIL
jgi:hypothetical protein